MRAFFILALCVYCICVILRFYYPYCLESFPQYFHKSAILLNTHDGYFYAQGAKNLLEFLKSDSANLLTLESLESFQTTFNAPMFEYLSILTASLAFLLPLSLEKILFFLPGFLGSLIVFPVIFATRNFGMIVCTLSGILSGIGISYYNRTMFGYYDTDMLLVTFDVCIAILAIYAKKPLHFALLTTLSAFALGYYANSRYILIAYCLILWILRSHKTANLGLILILCLSFLLDSKFLWIPLGFLLGLLLPFLQRFKSMPIISFALFLGILFGFVIPLAIQTTYLQSLFSTHTESFSYLNTLHSIAETSKIDLTTLAYRISGNSALFALSLVGYFWLILKHRNFLIFLPLLCLGFFALLQGLRFSFYAIPIAAIGFGFFALQCSCLFKKQSTQYMVMILLAFLAITPHLLHIKNYLVRPILESSEAQILENIPAKKGDFALSWWDYGYLINYFSDLNVFIDGGKHSGKQNFPISLALSHSNNTLSYNLAKLLLYQESHKDFLKQEYFEKLGFKQSLEILQSEPLNISSSGTIYVILPLSLLEIFPNVVAFSTLDLRENKLKSPKFFAISQHANSNQAIFKDNLSLEPSNGILSARDSKIQIHRFINLKDGETKTFNHNSSLVALRLLDDRIVLCDISYLESFYFQGLFFEKLDKNLFQKVLKNDKIIIYKLL